MEILKILAKAPEADRLPDFLPEVHQYIKQRLGDLMTGRIPLEELLVSQRLSRELTEYSTPSPAALASWQLQAEGKQVRPGQRVRFLYMRGVPGVKAWYASESADLAKIDTRRYRTLFMRAVEVVLRPIENHFGIMQIETNYCLFPVKSIRPLSEGVVCLFPEQTSLPAAASLPGS
jgi:DNA polymerase elongation subunit (family B)